MKKTLVCLLLGFLPLHADEDTFAERFADPETRDAALALLIPGTRDAFFHTALAHQLAGREDAFRKVMADWKSASSRRTNPVSSDGYDTLDNRRLLLEYRRNPKGSLAEITRRLGLRFDDSRPDAAAAAASLPTRLDPALIREEAFEKAAEKATPRAPYRHYADDRLLRELERVETFDEPKIRWFLEKIPRADLPGVVPLIDRSLALEKPVVFGSVALHGKLTASQLDSLLELHPGLKSNEAFAIAWMEKRLPGAETDLDRDRNALADHLRTCRDFALTLPDALNSLKAHVLFHHLRIQRELGQYPKEDFLAYLALPRHQHAILKPRHDNSITAIDPARDYRAATTCPPVGDDSVLVGGLLDHFLGANDDARPFAPFIEDAELKRLHARARLLAGADPARWAGMLEPSEFKNLQELERIEFAPGTPALLDGNAAVSLALDLKNTPGLLVRIYQIDAAGHLARHGREPRVDIDLEGLTPHHQRRQEFPHPPMQRHRETIALPELAGPGVWLVDFVSGQVSARALVRKGSLTPRIERGTGGQIVTVTDENGNALKEFSISLGRENLKSDADGRLIVPDAPNQPPTRGVLSAGPLAAMIELGPRSEAPELDARFHLDREQLLADRETRVLLRLRLSSHGVELPLDRLRDAALVLQADLLGGVTVERVVSSDLDLKPVMEVPFQVPADLLKLTLTLRGTVTPATGGEPLKLSAKSVYQINSDLKLARVGGAFLSPVEGGHRLEARGRNGEPLPSRAITLTCSRFDYEEEITVRVRTDEDGRVDLGRLDTIDYLTASGTDIGEVLYDPGKRSTDLPSALHIAAGSGIRLPLLEPAANPDRTRLSLLETRGEKPVRDHFDKLAIEGGELVVRALPPGDFQLVQGDETTTIRVSPAAPRHGWLVSKTRMLPAHSPPTPWIDMLQRDGNQVVVALRGHGPDTRVSLVGRRYRHADWSPGLGLYPFNPRIPDSIIPGFTGCDYLTDKRLSDETRYILDRRAAKTFAGSMLPRPGLLLHRWSEDDIEQALLTGDEGGAGEGRGSAVRKQAGQGGPGGRRDRDSSTELAAACDFLASVAVIQSDLKPGDDGTLRVPLEDFARCQFIEVTVTDRFADDMRVLPLPPTDTPLRDRRLARPFDPKVSLQATRAAAVLAKGATATIENLLDADWRAFTTLDEAHQFLFGMQPDDRLREFVFLTTWPELSDEKKLELHSKHACHELNLFLARRDPAFFNTHVKPLLEAKREPVFIDELLLGRDLKPYLRSFAWQRLNAAEKALLARALPEARARIARELSLRWELEAPSPEQETRLFTQTLRGTDLAITDSLGLARKDYAPAEAAGVSYLTEKLRRIIIPSIDFQDVTIAEALDFLRLRAAEMDSLELDPARKGINMVVRPSVPDDLRIKELRLRNVPIAQALKYVCDQAKLRYKVDDYAVTLVPQTETGEDIFTRTFQVEPDFAAALQGGSSGEDDPFAESSPGSRVVEPVRSITELLKNAGINFPEGTSATMSANGILLVTNSPSELDKIEQLTRSLACAPAMPAGIARPGKGFGRRTGEVEEEEGFAELPELPNSVATSSEVDPFAAPSAGSALMARRPQETLPRRFPERTRLWRESNYYRHAGQTNESLIPLNRFWLDLAAWDGNGAFLSPHFNACHRTVNEALMCLALLDLPFKAERPEVVVDGGALRVKARDAMLLFYKDTRRAEIIAEGSPLLVRQSFSPLDEKVRMVNGREVDNVMAGDFRPGAPYTASLVITNPTGTERRLEVLAQIPAGSIPLEGKPATLATQVVVGRHGVLKLELAFYFPAAGEFAVYPLHVSEDGVVMARTEPRTLRVSAEPAPVDGRSWTIVAAEGSADDVLARLRTENLRSIDLTAIRWRLRDRGFYQKATAILRERLHLPVEIASFGFLHNDPAMIREYLENSDAVHELGEWLDSPLLEIRPRVHHNWHTLEFDPLINPRAHRFTNAPRLTHEEAHRHYLALLGQLAWKPVLDDSDQLALTAMLLLQDRVGEALDRFPRIDPAKLGSQLHYDYLHAVVLFHEDQSAAAKHIAAPYTTKLPPGLWRDRFQAVVEQADEAAALLAGGAADKDESTPAAPRLDLGMTGDGRLRIEHRGLEKATLRLFGADLEMWFSNNPFLRAGNAGEPSIRPNQVMDVTLAKDAGETVVDLPEAMRKGSVLVYAKAGDNEVVRVLDSRAIDLRHLPRRRAVQVLSAADGKPLPRTYIKVYAEMRNGEVRFHKDGYTDPRGMFDCLSHTGVDAAEVKRLAVLASHSEMGARTMIFDR